MTDPEVFYNREDLWTVATEVGLKRRRPASDAADGAEFRADEAAGRNRRGVRRDPAVHAGQPEQSDRLDCRPQRRRHTTARRSSTTFPRRSWSTDRCRSRRESIRTRSSPDSCRCGISRARTCAAGPLLVIPIGTRAAVRGADLPAGRAQPDAGAAAGRARAAGSARVRTDLRVGDGVAVRWSGFVD